MSRNQGRVPAHAATVEAQPQQTQQIQQVNSPFDFIVATEVVDLPSRGEYYPEGHPLHGIAHIEIKHMTAKEEDILTSSSLLKKGIAIDKMLQSVIVDKNIKIDDLLLGDKNALLVMSRVYGYGPDYQAQAICPHCGTSSEYNFNLKELNHKQETLPTAVEKTENNTFSMTLPKSGMEIEYRLLTSRDEKEISKTTGGSLELLKKIIVSINNQHDKMYIQQALNSLPILDTSLLKRAYLATMPDVDMTQKVECPACGEEAEMGVPLDANFFWPNL